MLTVELTIPVRDLQPGDRFRDEWTIQDGVIDKRGPGVFVKIIRADGTEDVRKWFGLDHVITITRDVPEPEAEWAKGEARVSDSYTDYIFIEKLGFGTIPGSANARRFVALWNLAHRKGWSTEDIEAMGKEKHNTPRKDA